MNKLNCIYQIMLSGFYQRIRTSQYLIVLILTIIFGYIAIPPTDAVYTTLSIDGYRGYYNSAWFGAIGGVWLSMFLSFFGFFVIKNAILIDEQNKMGEIIASTQVSNIEYAWGKMLSNFLILLSIVVIFNISLILMYFIRSEPSVFNPWLIFAPSLLISLPTMLIISALGVIFEIIPFLKKGFGNILYFIIWMVFLIISIENLGLWDPFGVNIILDSIFQQGVLQVPDMNPGNFIIGSGNDLDPNNFIIYDGAKWTLNVIFTRFVWILISFGMVLLISPFFSRFSKETGRLSASKILDSKNEKNGGKIEKDSNISAQTRDSINSLQPKGYFADIGTIIKLELKVYLSSIPKWWFFVLAGLMIAAFFTPVPIMQMWVLPITWFWPVLIWSKLGLNEVLNGTSSIEYSTPYPLKKHFLATWIVALILTLGTGIAIGIRFLFTSNWMGFIAWLVGGYFIAAFAIMSGTLSHSSKLFEFLYVLIWYIGPINQVPWLDYLGAVPSAIEMNIWAIFLAIAAFFTLISFITKKHDIQNSI